MKTKEILEIKKPFFGYTGKVYHIRGTYESNVCDICGRIARCAWFEPPAGDYSITGMDICISCQQDLEAKE